MVDTDAVKIEERIRKVATEARSEAVVAIFFFGVVVGPIALLRIAAARKRIRETGAGENLLDHLKTSQTIAIVAILVWAVGILLKLAGAV